MCGHYLVEPTACTPASGWEKGQVENQVGNLRQRLFTPRLRVTSYAELNAWLLDRCVAYAKANPHPELNDQTIWQVFEAERAKLVPISGRFDGFRATRPRSPRPAWCASTTTSIRLPRVRWVGRSRSSLTPSASSSVRTAPLSASMRAASAATRRSMIPGITSRCSPESPARCVTARLSKTGHCRPAWSMCGAS